MSKLKTLRGIIAYPITPFDAEEKVDIHLFKKLTDRLVTSGSHAIAPLGSTGVLPYLNDQEKEAVVEATVEVVAGRVPIVAGVSNLTTERTIYHARFAETAGAAAVMIIPMSYWKLTDDEIFAHYRKVAEAISIPIMAYNNPATGGIDMSPALLKRLLEIPNVTMIKESTGDVQRMHYLRRVLGEEVAFFNGSNPLALAAFSAGAVGWCTAAPNLIPELNHRLYDAILANDLAGAREVFDAQSELLTFITANGLPRTIAAGLQIQGIESGLLRSPLAPLGAGDYLKLKSLLGEVG
ncbi:dihydrodipicolinate synthase family protein [Dyadobacter jiangsuensis]|uniref:4-hydroxy-tetrahydrodipicolinate synthase n=1 Tax=Dyadobacter jiangsuensis TaxID=1591085 RepID=A0A2P8GB96_9BACT|nr:dihydrodipicolinate synthase family protein [Dyadobacter jiangsuensis]PSL31250.1 4-hydroxy-tetrahydrodipicolinate synthase [Dyadobacter jiangsuensis]